MLLRVDRIESFYGRSQTLHGVSLTVDEGELICVLGANGAGKSTLLKNIAGLVKPRQGTIEFPGSGSIGCRSPDRPRRDHLVSRG